MRKTPAKRQRIPRRGPGVAELEKILQEQEGQDSDTPFQDMSPPPQLPPPTFVFQPHHDSPSISTLNPPPPPPSLTPLPLLLPREFSSRPNLPTFPTLRLMPPALPTTEKPPHFFPSFQFASPSLNRQYYNPMENFTPASASSCPPPSSPAARYFNQIEHPSSQRSSDFNHPWTSPEEQEQIVSAKRARPFVDERHRDPNLESRRVLPNLLSIAVKEGSSSSSSSQLNRSAIYLDSNLSGSYQLGEDGSSLMALRSSSTPNQFAPFHFQETMEASQHRDGGSASDYKNSKSKSKGIVVTAIGSQAEPEPEAEPENEAEGDGIDLDLKL